MHARVSAARVPIAVGKKNHRNFLSESERMKNIISEENRFKFFCSVFVVVVVFFSRCIIAIIAKRIIMCSFCVFYFIILSPVVYVYILA